MNKLINNQNGYVALIMVTFTIIALAAIGWAIDMYRIRVDRINLARVADITAYSTAITAQGTDEEMGDCIITDSTFEIAKLKTFDANKGNNNSYQIILTSSDFEKEHGIVRVFAKSVVPLFFATPLAGGSAGFTNAVTSEAKCSLGET